MFTVEEMREMLPSFIEKEFPKAKDKDRGFAIMVCALFIEYLRKNEIQ